MKKYFQNHLETVVGIGIWIVTAAIYFITMARTVQFIDSGELATAASTLSIAHPTGYPLFTIIAKIFSEIPVSAEIIIRLNLMSVLFVSLAIVVFYNLMLEYLKNETREIKIIASAIAAFTLAFSETVWNQATAVEVYSLHLLMITLTLFALQMALHSEEIRWWMAFAFVFGLSFTNHMTTILLIPAIIYIYFTIHGAGKYSWKKIGVLAFPFIIAISLYTFLYVRSSSQPILNWGNPSTLEKLLWHISGKQFRVWMFSSTETASRQFKYFLSNITEEFFVVMLFLAVAGFLFLMFKNKKRFVFVFLLLVACVAYSINYDIHDIDSYFLLAFLSIAIFVGYGIIAMFQTITKLRIAVVILLLSMVVVQIARTWDKTDESNNFIVEDYTLSILNHLPKNAIVISYQWDYFISATYYFQHIKNVRPDVIVLDKELFRRSWYLQQLQNLHPRLMEKSKNEIDLFLNELYKFEHNLPYDFYAIEGSYTNLLKSFIDKNIDSVRIFVGREIEQNYTGGYLRVPNNLMYELRKDTGYVSTSLTDVKLRTRKHQDNYTFQLKKIAATWMQDRSIYERMHSRINNSIKFSQKAQEILK